MRQNVRTKNPEEKDIKFQKIKIQSIQAGETMPGWQVTPGKESTRLKTRLRKIAKYGKIKKLSQTKTSS